MRTFYVLLDREIRSFFNTPIAYVVLMMFTMLLGFSFYSGVAAINHLHSASITVIEVEFSSFIFWFGYILCVSLISMRSFADEFRMGTLENLTTAPVKDWQVVLAKYAGVLLFYVVLFAPTILFFYVLRWVSGGSVGLASIGAFGATYLMLLLVGMFAVSVGCLASSMVKDQINAAVISFVTIAVFFFLPLFMTSEDLVHSPELRRVGTYFCAYFHMKDACTGRLDTQQLVLYPTLTLLMLFLTLQVFQYRKWRT